MKVCKLDTAANIGVRLAGVAGSVVGMAAILIPIVLLDNWVASNVSAESKKIAATVFLVTMGSIIAALCLRWLLCANREGIDE